MCRVLFARRLRGVLRVQANGGPHARRTRASRHMEDIMSAWLIGECSSTAERDAPFRDTGFFMKDWI